MRVRQKPNPQTARTRKQPERDSIYRNYDASSCDLYLLEPFISDPRSGYSFRLPISLDFNPGYDDSSSGPSMS